MTSGEVLGPKQTKWTTPAGNSQNVTFKRVLNKMSKSKNKANSRAKRKATKMTNQKAGVPNRVQVRMQVPKFLSTPAGLRLSNREFLLGNSITAANLFRGGSTGVVAGAGAGPYTASYGSIYIAPSAFQWLGTIAQGYANYRFLSFKVHYVPIVPTTTGGLVSLVSFPNADDGPNNVSTTAALIASETGSNSVQGAAWDPNLSITHDCSRYREPKPNVEYQNIGTSVPTTVGIFPRNYATSGLVLWWYQPDTGEVRSPGRLYAEYVVELMDPVAHITSD